VMISLCYNIVVDSSLLLSLAIQNNLVHGGNF